MQGLALDAGEGLDALSRYFVQNAVDLVLVGRRRGGAGGVRALGDVVAGPGPETPQQRAFEELVDIEKPGERAGEVGGMGDAGGRIAGQQEFDQGEAGDQLPGHHRDGENEEDQEGKLAPGIEGGKGGQHAEDGTGGSDAQGMRLGGEPDPAETAQQATEQVHGQEVLRAHGALGLGTEEIQREHVEKEMGKAAVQEHVGQRLPDHAVLEAGKGKSQQGVEPFQSQQQEYKKGGNVGLDDPGADGGQMGEEARRPGGAELE